MYPRLHGTERKRDALWVKCWDFTGPSGKFLKLTFSTRVCFIHSTSFSKSFTQSDLVHLKISTGFLFMTCPSYFAHGVPRKRPGRGQKSRFLKSCLGLRSAGACSREGTVWFVRNRSTGSWVQLGFFLYRQQSPVKASWTLRLRSSRQSRSP